MSEHFSLLIVGAGPAGLSAAGRAAYYDSESGAQSPSYVLLEAYSSFARTIQRYQKGKHVMDEPSFLDLRSEMPFAAGTREALLSAWEGPTERDLNIRVNSKVSAINRQEDGFRIGLNDDTVILAERVVLAIGTQGNPRLLGVDGDQESDFVRYTLDDPGDYEGEIIVVVGAGDAAIENAIALADRNQVFIVNRRKEFSRAKDGNLSAILHAINDKSCSLDCRYEASVATLEPPARAGATGSIVLNTPTGTERIACHRTLCRLGSVLPRAFVEACGIEVGGAGADALPSLDRHYQSSVPGLYVIGALAGFPLIKQAMNQGYDVVEYIRGKDIRPADYPLLQSRFSGLPYAMDAEDVLELYLKRVPMFRHMNPLAFRELVIESRVLVTLPPSDMERSLAADDRATIYVAADEALYRHGEYGSSFFTLVEGEVRLQLEEGGDWHSIRAGQFFGEMSLISGRPREGDAVVAADSILIETPRRIMVKLMNSNETVRSGIDRVFVIRALQAAFRPRLPLVDLARIATDVGACSFEAGEVIYTEGEDGDHLHLLRSGTVVLSRGGSDAIAQLHSGELVGQLALMGSPLRRETAKAAVRTETIKIRRAEFLALIGSRPEQVEILQQRLAGVLTKATAMASRPEAARAIGFLMAEGLGEATNALVIDETLCIGCDNCEVACAETHGGISRLNRTAGASMAKLHVPVSCRHCEIPHCMKDCPPDAIRRAPGGEVFIVDSCIGCGNCETNCPYDAIELRYPAPDKPGLWSWLLFGRGSGPGDLRTQQAGVGDAEKKAVKCDACMGHRGGPACVRACPTGAAIRLGPDQFVDLVSAHG